MIYLLALILSVSACTKAIDPIPMNRKVVDMKNFEEDVIIPAELYAEIEKQHRPLALDPEAEKKSEEDKQVDARGTLKTKVQTEQVPIKVFLIEHTRGILGGQNFELQYPIGGGLLDYKHFVQGPEAGFFKLFIKMDDTNPKDLKVFYLSNAKIRKIGNKTIGNGCGRFFDMSTFWQQAQSKGGVELYTGDQRHISLTSGIFFFVVPYKGKLRLAHLTIKDTRYKDLECRK